MSDAGAGQSRAKNYTKLPEPCLSHSSYNVKHKSFAMCLLDIDSQKHWPLGSRDPCEKTSDCPIRAGGRLTRQREDTSEPCKL